jgi:hypothetical protein
MTQFIEPNQAGLGESAFSRIEKQAWQPVGPETAYVPALQQLIVSGAKAAFVGLAGITGSILVSVAFPQATLEAVLVSLGGGLLAGLYDFQRNIDVRYSDSREGELSRELYEKQLQAEAATSNERITLEWIERNADGSVKRAVYDELGVSRDDLALVARAERLSKRGLMDVGLNDAQAMRLLTQLLALGYITRQADNLPAEWTSKGKAVKRAFAGGGGGGGA